MAEELQSIQQAETQKSLVDQAGQIAGTPLMDPTKNPQMMPEDEPPME